MFLAKPTVRLRNYRLLLSKANAANLTRFGRLHKPSLPLRCWIPQKRFKSFRRRSFKTARLHHWKMSCAMSLVLPSAPVRVGNPLLIALLFAAWPPATMYMLTACATQAAKRARCSTLNRSKSLKAQTRLTAAEVRAAAVSIYRADGLAWVTLWKAMLGWVPTIIGAARLTATGNLRSMPPSG